MKFDPTLYLVTDSTGRTDDDFLSILERALTGGVTLVQLREKERGGGEYLRLARLTKAVCDRYRVPLIIDDSVPRRRGLPRHGRDLPDDHEGENRADAGFAPERCLPQRADPGCGHRRFKCRKHGCFEWQSH